MRRAGACLAVALLAGAGSAQADPLPPWTRSAPLPLPENECQQLVVGRRGAAPLELRFPTAPLAATGTDAKRSGASLVVPPSPSDPASAVFFDRAGLYPAALSPGGSLRWHRRGRGLCFATSNGDAACGRTRRALGAVQLIAFAPGWRASLRPCPTPAPPGRGSPLPPSLLALALAVGGTLLVRRRRAETPWLVGLALPAAASFAAWLDPAGIDPRVALGTLALALALAVVRLLQRVRKLSGWDAAYALTALAVALAGEEIAHPQSLPASKTSPPAPIPSLWTDPAYWHPAAFHQTLSFRGDPPAGEEKTWLVLGGSVTFGDGVAPEATFVKTAERQLRAAGHRVRLLNAGAQAWNLGQIDRLLRDLGASLAPDGLVIASVLNNAHFRLPEARPVWCDGRLLAATLCNLIRSPTRLALAKLLAPKPGNRGRFRRTLRAILDRARAQGRPVVLLDETSRWQIEASPRDRRHEAYRAAIRETAADYGLALHAVDRAVAAVPASARFLDAIHLAPAGHEAVGARLAEVLAPHLDGPRSGAR